MSIGNELDDTVAAWSAYCAELGGDWPGLVEGVAAKDAGCGPIYELGNPLGRPGEDFAIADMRALPASDPHYHRDGQVEIYLVLQGTSTVVVGGEAREVGPRDVVVTPPGTAHYTIPHDQLVLGVVNVPPFDPAKYVPVSESDPAVGFDAALFARLAERREDVALAQLVRDLASELDVWATVLLVPNHQRTALAARARHNLPDDWATTGNFLDSGSMNARVFHTQRELVENGIEEFGPPTTRPVTRHRFTAAASVPVPGVGTLEALADADGYEFDESGMRHLREAAAQVVSLLT